MVSSGHPSLMSFNPAHNTASIGWWDLLNSAENACMIFSIFPPGRPIVSMWSWSPGYSFWYLLPCQSHNIEEVSSTGSLEPDLWLWGDKEQVVQKYWPLSLITGFNQKHSISKSLSLYHLYISCQCTHIAHISYPCQYFVLI